MQLSRRTHYLQIALNSTLDEARAIIAQIPEHPRIIFEAGTPLIKQHGMDAIGVIRTLVGPNHYIVADLKTMDRGETEVDMAARAGANGVIALGSAPIETLNAFIAACDARGLDAMIDMMNIEFPIQIIAQLKKRPRVVVLHRGVDEEAFNKEKAIPYSQIQRLKGAYDMMIAIAGGDSLREVQRSFFNNADIVIVWKSFYTSSAETGALAQEFLRQVK